MIALTSATGRNNAEKDASSKQATLLLNKNFPLDPAKSQLPFENPQWQDIYVETGAIGTASVGSFGQTQSVLLELHRLPGITPLELQCVCCGTTLKLREG
jgi:hypothetical protein